MKKKSKNILVVGGTGFIGHHLIKHSLKKNYKVTSISIKKPTTKNLFRGVEYISCDIRDKKKLEKKLKKPFNYVVNLGGYVDHSKKKETFSSHYNGAKNLAQIFLSRNIESFIQLGSGLEYGKTKLPQKESFECKPRSTYSLAKFKTSKYLLDLFKKKKFPTNIIRLYQSYGPNQKFNRLIPFVIKACLKNKKFECTDGLQKRDFLYIDDLINLIFKILKSKKIHGYVFNAGSGKPIKIRSLIEKIKIFSLGGLPDYGKIKMRKDEIKDMYPSIYSAQKLLGWKPRISINAGLKKTIKFYREKL